MIPNSQMQYRADIDGIRAIAVLSVVIYHYFPEILASGYIGVDLFFVISGYLITNILLTENLNHSFSILSFYKRRINRIFPALILILLFSIGVGYSILWSSEFEILGKHVVGASTFLSNFILWDESGYFDRGAINKPLLHMWSLAIEEQFYIAWPLFVFALYRKKNLFLILLPIVFIASFAVNGYLANTDATADFYNPLSRAWELLVGASLAVFLTLHKSIFHKNTLQMFSTLGVVLLIAGLTMGKKSTYPSVWALLPCLSCAFLIAATPNAWFNKYVLTQKWMVFIGLISYPLYLWHWPILYFTNLFVSPINHVYAVCCVAASVVLAYLTYKIIERPLTHVKTTKKTIALLVVLISVGCIGALIQYQIIKPRLYSNVADGLSFASQDWQFPKGLQPDELAKNSSYFIKGTGHKNILFWGDSHAEQYGPKVVDYINKNPNAVGQVYFNTLGACFPISSIYLTEGDTDECELTQANAQKQLKTQHFDTVVVAMCWNCFFNPHAYLFRNTPNRDLYEVEVGDKNESTLLLATPQGQALALQQIKAFIQQLTKQHHVYVLLDNPIDAQFDPTFIHFSRFNNNTEVPMPQKIKYPPSQQLLQQKLINLFKNTDAHVIKTSEYICHGDWCDSFDHHQPIYKDSNHQRPYYVVQHASFIEQVLK